MASRTLIIFGVFTSVLLVAILAIVLSLLLTNPAQAQPAGGASSARHVTVIGQGEVKGIPDTAYVQIGVETEANTTQAALAQNNTQAEAIIARLKELGVAEKDIQTSSFNISATYDNAGRQVVGYRVSNMVSVTIRDLDQAGTLLDQVVQVGANRVYGISFGVADPTELLTQARDQAVADARVRAGQLAQSSGNNLGDILVITESIGSMPFPVPQGRGFAEDAMASVPIQTGEQSFSAQVQVTFALR